MQMKSKLKNLFEKNKMRIDNILFYSTVIGVLLLSAGVYIMGSGTNRPIGRDMIILGSGIFYISVIALAFKL